MTASSSTIAMASPVNDTNCVNSVSVETNGYHFTVCTTNINPKVGDDITVKATLKNISTNDVVVVSSVPLLDDTIQVLWQGKQSMNLTSYGRHSKDDDISWAKRHLESGVEITESFQINRLFEMTNAGDYEIIISRRIRIRNDTEWGTIDAPPLKVSLKHP